MKKYKRLVGVLVGLLLSGCAVLTSNTHPGKLERVGVLLVKNCGDNPSCDQFSLLSPDMQTPETALSGRIDTSLEGRLIAVLGKQIPTTNGRESLYVEQHKSITEFNYLPFMVGAVSDYAEQNFPCISLWDQHYTWRLDGRQPIFTATLARAGRPDSGTVLLDFDGLNRSLMSAQVLPDGAVPCQGN